MKPKNSPQADASPLQLFQSRLDSQINPDHPLCQLAERIDWDRFDDAYSPLYCEDNGAPALPTRLMVALEYLKYTYNLSDEALVMRWLALKTFTGHTGSISAAKFFSNKVTAALHIARQMAAPHRHRTTQTATRRNRSHRQKWKVCDRQRPLSRRCGHDDRRRLGNNFNKTGEIKSLIIMYFWLINFIYSTWMSYID